MNYTKLNMTNEEYSQYVEDKSPKSPIVKNCILAFIVGGIICMIGQAITDVAMNYGLEKKDASGVATVILIFLGAVLTALKIYHVIGKHAGAGSIVPITGFSNSIVSPAIEHKTEGLVLGIGANMFKIAGPVLVYGILSSFVIGFICWIISLF